MFTGTKRRIEEDIETRSAKTLKQGNIEKDEEVFTESQNAIIEKIIEILDESWHNVFSTNQEIKNKFRKFFEIRQKLSISPSCMNIDEEIFFLNEEEWNTALNNNPTLKKIGERWNSNLSCDQQLRNEFRKLFQSDHILFDLGESNFINKKKFYDVIHFTASITVERPKLNCNDIKELEKAFRKLVTGIHEMLFISPENFSKIVVGTNYTTEDNEINLSNGITSIDTEILTQLNKICLFPKLCKTVKLSNFSAQHYDKIPEEFVAAFELITQGKNVLLKVLYNSKFVDKRTLLTFVKGNMEHGYTQSTIYTRIQEKAWKNKFLLTLGFSIRSILKLKQSNNIEKQFNNIEKQLIENFQNSQNELKDISPDKIKTLFEVIKEESHKSTPRAYNVVLYFDAFFLLVKYCGYTFLDCDQNIQKNLIRTVSKEIEIYTYYLKRNQKHDQLNCSHIEFTAETFYKKVVSELQSLKEFHNQNEQQKESLKKMKEKLTKSMLDLVESTQQSLPSNEFHDVTTKAKVAIVATQK